MAIDLVSASGRFYFSNHQWEETLLLAKDYGWTPLDAPDAPWERVYFSSGGSSISQRDAASLADALRRALPKQSDSEKLHLQQFIAFCNNGGFTIE